MSLIFIRADGNSEIGSGHVMRCLSIADALRNKGAQCFFVCADENMRGRIEQAGFSFLCLHSGYRHMEKELPALFDFIQEKQPNVMLLDSYFVTAKYMEAVRSRTPLAYLDDVNAFLYPADMLINYNMFSFDFKYDKIYKDTKTKLLLGCRYTPLRREFQNLPPRKQPGQLRRILVSTGGADPMEIGLALVRYAKERREYEWHFIVGGLNAREEKMRKAVGKEKHIHLHTQVTEMAKLMCGCELAVSASGSTLYELCACGTPTFCYTFADNQVPGAEIFAQKKLMVSLGDYRNGADAFLEKLNAALVDITGDMRKWSHSSAGMQAVVDGHGAARLAEELFLLDREQAR